MREQQAPIDSDAVEAASRGNEGEHRRKVISAIIYRKEHTYPMLPPNSDVARLRQRVVDEETAARFGLTGLALSAQHEFITARATRGAARILELVEQGQITQAQALMDQPNWGVEEEEVGERFSEEMTPVAPGKGEARR